jgi:hypothetical protein
LSAEELPLSIDSIHSRFPSCAGIWLFIGTLGGGLLGFYVQNGLIEDWQQKREIAKAQAAARLEDRIYSHDAPPSSEKKEA